MNFFKPTVRTLLPSVLLVAFAALPILILRYTLYAILAVPLMPLIRSLGWMFNEKPAFLTPAAALITAVIWALPLFVLSCLVRWALTETRLTR